MCTQNVFSKVLDTHWHRLDHGATVERGTNRRTGYQPLNGTTVTPESAESSQRKPLTLNRALEGGCGSVQRSAWTFLGLCRKVVTAEVGCAVSTHALKPVPLLQIFTPLCVRGLVRFS